MTFIRITFLLILSLQLSAQTVYHVGSQFSFGGDNNDNAYALAQTSDGGFIIAGSTNSNDNGDIPLSYAYNGNGGTDFLVLKINVQGTIQWIKTFGGSDADVATDIARTSNGEYVVVGSSRSVDGDANFNGPNGGILIIRLKEDGSLVSKRIIPGGRRFTEDTYHFANEFSQPSVEVDKSGYIYVGGTYEIGSNPYKAKDFYLTKLTPTGDTLWEKYFGSSLDDQMHGLAIDNVGNVVMVGSTSALANEINGAGNGNLDYLVIKTNSNGQLQWQKAFGGSNIDALHGITVNPNGSGYIAVGETSSTNGIVTESFGQKDGHVLGISSSGSLLWQTKVGGDGNDNLYNILVESNKSLLAFGTSDSRIRGVQSKGSLTDVFTVKLNPNGVIEDLGMFGGEDIDVARGGAVLTDGTVALACISRSESEDLTRNNGENDFWFVNLTPPDPIEFEYFRGELVDKSKINLSWHTLYQDGADIIRLEKSLDNKNFVRLQDFNASANTTSGESYAYTDNNIGYGTFYYRLKFYNKAGKEFKGPFVTITNSPLASEPVIQNSANDWVFYPNPAKERLIVPVKDAGASFDLYDAMGNRRSFYAQYAPYRGWTFDLRELSSGTYLLKVNAGAQSATKRFVVR
ncbi:T9SS type A sorting domain-containing protein [Jiulongibacter sp. NS-SX5]|uniref:T9SS type A sorting domain-containing protein n=1 Tax=Jiulongibacter sp. NS-SX5 TaxID=3463854 RepID=UPI0040580A74